MGLWFLSAVAICCVILTISVLYLVPARPDKTLSQHIMCRRETILLGKALLTIAGVLLIIWTAQSQIPPVLMIMLAWLSINFVMMGLLPYGVSRRQNLFHDIAAWGSVPLALLFEISILVLFFNHIGLIVGSVLAIQSLLLSVLIVPQLKKLRPKLMLAGQLVFFTGLIVTLFALEIGHA